MKRNIRITALVLAIIIAFSSIAIVSAEEPEAPAAEITAGIRDSFFEGREPGTEKGFSFSRLAFGGDVNAITTDGFFRIINVFRSVFLGLGKLIPGVGDPFQVTMDDDLAELCRYLGENSCFDPYQLLTNLPDINGLADAAIKVFHIDTVEFRNEMMAAKDKCFADGESAKGYLCWIAACYFSKIESANLALVSRGEKNVYEIVCEVVYSDGAPDDFRTNMFINTETGEFFGPDEEGAAGLGFNCSIEELLVYAPMYCWMRDFGFCFEYDLLCFFLPMYRYNTRRIRFDYGGKEWMVQMWKGNYLITNGGEVGLYNRKEGSFGTFYNTVTDEERVPMSLEVYHGDDLLVNIPETTHWWVNGFRYASNKLYSPVNLDLFCSIQFYDEEMANAFCAAAAKNFYGDIECRAEGTTVYVAW